jgi:hypothetical protein
MRRGNASDTAEFDVRSLPGIGWPGQAMLSAIDPSRGQQESVDLDPPVAAVGLVG